MGRWPRKPVACGRFDEDAVKSRKKRVVVGSAGRLERPLIAHPRSRRGSETGTEHRQRRKKFVVVVLMLAVAFRASLLARAEGSGWNTERRSSARKRLCAVRTVFAASGSSLERDDGRSQLRSYAARLRSSM